MSKRKFNSGFWEPFSALRGLFDIKKIPKSDLEKMNQSMVADMLGDDPIIPPPSRLKPEALNLFYSIQDIYGSVGRFSIYRRMFLHYPWRGKITKSEHLSSTYYLFVHECYVFEERLKKFFQHAEAYARSKEIILDLKKPAREILKLHKKILGTAVRMRGVHVHKDDFKPRDIQRVGLLETTISAYAIRQKHVSRRLQKYRDSVLREVRKHWAENCEQAEEASEQIAALSFRVTKPLWTKLSQE